MTLTVDGFVKLQDLAWDVIVFVLLIVLLDKHKGGIVTRLRVVVRSDIIIFETLFAVFTQSTSQSVRRDVDSVKL